MRTFLSCAIVLAALSALTSTSPASITGVNCYNDGDGAILMNDWSWADAGEEYAVNLDETLNWCPAHALVDITATPEDPIVRFTKEVENGSGFAWTGYTINISQSNSFTVLGATAPDDWSVVYTQPVLHGSRYVATLTYTGGTPVEVGEVGTFKARVSFVGSADFCLEQIAVPEPGTIVILAAGVVGLVVKRRRHA